MNRSSEMRSHHHSHSFTLVLSRCAQKMSWSIIFHPCVRITKINAIWMRSVRHAGCSVKNNKKIWKQRCVKINENSGQRHRMYLLISDPIRHNLFCQTVWNKDNNYVLTHPTPLLLFVISTPADEQCHESKRKEKTFYSTMQLDRFLAEKSYRLWFHVNLGTGF